MVFILWIFSIGYLFQHFGTVLQILRIEKKRDIEGVCVDTQILFLLGAIARCFWVTDTMLKDFFLTYVELALALTTLIYTLYICLFKYNGVQSIGQCINNKNIPIVFRWYSIFTVSAILSYFFFPGNEGQKWDIQMLVSLNIFSEAAGLLPQIYAVNSQKDSNIVSSFYLICLSVSRILRLYFWIQMNDEENSFRFLLIADVLHLIMVSGFIYSFFKNLDQYMLPTESKRDDGKKIF
jgi:uncharacterized protein with PQ loop repeat